ncbi:MAG TPA: alpha/beta hydrolase [Acidobacteriaceae bacterium]|jgi:acetyl esterase/lipase|nr:alpha/beta hydrolase [Acidobacteriaceae bacterium]
MKRKTFAGVVSLQLLFALSLPAQTVVPLWPKATPEPAHTTEAEKDVTKPSDNLISGHRTSRITNVVHPSMTVYPPTGGAGNSGAAAVVFPGGGYIRLAWEGEGVDSCKWLNSIGVTCLLVKYRVPFKETYPANPADLEDAQQAIRLARAHAAQWHLNPHKIGVLGYSAGAHLAVALSTHWDDKHVESTPAASEVDASVSARPDFALIIYPAYLTADASMKALTPDLTPRSDTPPTFLLQAENDPVHVENALVYFRALKDAGVEAELHIFPTGGHGFGLHPVGSPEEHWTQLGTAWLRSIKMLPAQGSGSSAIAEAPAPPVPCPAQQLPIGRPSPTPPPAPDNPACW